MLKRRRNAGLRLNSTGERGATVNNSASISSNNASARREKTPSSLWRKVCRSCKGAGVVIPPNHRQILNLVKPSGEWGLNFSMVNPNDLVDIAFPSQGAAKGWGSPSSTSLLKPLITQA